MNMNDLLSHVLFVEGAGQILAERGQISNSAQLTPEGIAAYNELMASGWKPQRRIVRMVLKNDGVLPPNLNAITNLIMSVADDYQTTDEQ